MELCISVTWSVYNFMIYTFFLPLWTAVSRSIRNIHCGICHTVNLCSLFIHLAIFYFCSWFEYLFSWRKSKARASGDWQKLNDLCSVSRHWPLLYLSLSLCFLLPRPGPDPASPPSLLSPLCLNTACRTGVQGSDILLTQAPVTWRSA